MRFERPGPETEAVRRLLDAVQPEVLLSLHNSVFQGVYTLISPQGAPLAPLISETLHARGLRPRSPCPIPYVETYAEGVFGLPHARLEIDYLRELDPHVPLSFYDNGAASFDYVGATCLSFVMELPMFDWVVPPNEGRLRRCDLGARHLAWWEQWIWGRPLRINGWRKARARSSRRRAISISDETQTGPPSGNAWPMLCRVLSRCNRRIGRTTCGPSHDCHAVFSATTGRGTGAGRRHGRPAGVGAVSQGPSPCPRRGDDLARRPGHGSASPGWDPVGRPHLSH